MPALRAFRRPLVVTLILAALSVVLLLSAGPSAFAATCGGLNQQAENGELSGHFRVYAGSRNYVGVPNGAPAAAIDDYVEFCVTIPSDGVYRVDAIVRSPSSADDSFKVQLNQRDRFIFDTGVNTSWKTVPVSSRQVNEPVRFGLSAGNNRLRFYQREDGTFLDAISLVRVGGTPTRLAGAAPAPTPTPTVSNDGQSAASATVRVEPSDNLRLLVREYPAGTTFLMQAGIHRNVFRVEPRNDQRIIGQDGTIIDGGGQATTAFRGLGRRVEIRKLEIRNYKPGLNAAPVSARDGATGEFARDWVVADNYIHNNNAAGINVGSGMRIIRNRITQNAQIGISGLGTVNNPLVGVDIIENTITGNANNTWFDFNHHEGGIKLTTARDVTISGNAIHNNKGVGIYCDVYCDDVTIEKNRLIDNGGRANGGGVYFEVSSRGRIRENYVDGMGDYTSTQHGGVTVAESQDVRVEDNTIRMANGVGVMVRNLTQLDHPSRGRDALTDIVIRDNKIVSTGGSTRIGLIGGTRVADGEVQYLNNDYRRGTGSIRFLWSGDGGTHTWAEWRERGYDLTGTLQ